MKLKKILPVIFSGLFISSFNTCGRKGDPLPPKDFHPATPENINIIQEYKSPVVSWNPPSKFIDGRTLTDMEKKRLTYIVNINFDKKLKKTKKTTFKDNPVKTEEKRCYKIASIYKDIIGEFSEPICVTGQKSIEKLPEIEKINATDGKIIFEFKNYKKYTLEIFKSESSDGFNRVKPFTSINKTLFVDTKVKNNRTYYYKFRFSKENIKGKFTETFELTPKDNIRPLPPKNITIVKTDKTCYLIWEPSESKDVVKYKVFFNSKKIGETTSLIFKTECKKGTYYVGAVDKAGNITPSKPIKGR